MANSNPDTSYLQLGRKITALMRQGLTNAQARKRLGLPPKGQKGKPVAARSGRDTLVVLDVDQTAPRRGRPPKRRASSSSRETMVPDDAGDEMTTRGGARLHASFGGHVVVKFDGPAVAAALGGFLEQLQYGTNANLALLYPALYPEQAATARAQRQWIQEKTMGQEMAKLLGTALAAYGVTPEQWGEYYAQAMASAPPLPPARPLMGRLGGDGADLSDSGFGSPLALPSAVTGPFGQTR